MWFSLTFPVCSKFPDWKMPSHFSRFPVRVGTLANVSTKSKVSIFTARKRSLRRLCFYTCLSFILFTGGGEYLTRYIPPTQTPSPQPGTPPGANPPPDQVYPPRSRHPPGPGTPPLGQVHPLGPGTPPEQSMLGDTVNVRAVRILLECNLVSSCRPYAGLA